MKRGTRLWDLGWTTFQFCLGEMDEITCATRMFSRLSSIRIASSSQFASFNSAVICSPRAWSPSAHGNRKLCIKRDNQEMRGSVLKSAQFSFASNSLDFFFRTHARRKRRSHSA